MSDDQLYEEDLEKGLNIDDEDLGDDFKAGLSEEEEEEADLGELG